MERNIRSIICMTNRNLENYAHFSSLLLLCSILLLIYLDFATLYYYFALYYYSELKSSNIRALVYVYLDSRCNSEENRSSVSPPYKSCAGKLPTDYRYLIGENCNQLTTDKVSFIKAVWQ